MIVCHVCGTNNPDSNKFCEGCGVELQAAAPVAAPEAQAVPAPVAPAPEAPVVTPVPAPEVAAPEIAAPAPVETPPLAEAPAAPTPAPEVAAAPVVAAVVSQDPEPKPSETLSGAATAAEIVGAAAPAAPGVVTEPRAEAVGLVGPKLIARHYGQLTSFAFPLQGTRLVVGRFDPSTGPVDLDLSNQPGKEHVSRRHAELFLENGKWSVRDLGSTNGVYVKHTSEDAFGPRIQAPVVLQNGDEVAFGNVQFVYEES